jgi:4a-hydroxytetrahydrobiopterin dehydratase
MSRSTEPITPHELSTTAVLADWRYLLAALAARFDTGGFGAGARLVQAIGEVAGEMDHHPDVDLRYDHVTVRTSSHDVGAVTSRDVDLARRISELAAEVGASARPELVSSLEIGLDVLDEAAVRPFWAAVLGYREGDGDVLDPAGRHAALWFQQMDEPRAQRNRFHLDITVPHDVAEQRVAAALAAGGRLLTDGSAPAFWVLADAEGNEVCVCTWQGRDGSGGDLTDNAPGDASGVTQG